MIQGAEPVSYFRCSHSQLRCTAKVDPSTQHWVDTPEAHPPPAKVDAPGLQWKDSPQPVAPPAPVPPPGEPSKFDAPGQQWRESPEAPRCPVPPPPPEPTSRQWTDTPEAAPTGLQAPFAPQGPPQAGFGPGAVYPQTQQVQYCPPGNMMMQPAPVCS